MISEPSGVLILPRPKIRGGNRRSARLAPVFSYSRGLRTSTSVLVSHVASLSMFVDDREDLLVVQAHLSAHGTVSLALLDEKDSPDPCLHIDSSVRNHD